jgi:hypothetical protein
MTDDSKPLSQKIRDQHGPDDLTVREPDEKTIEIGYRYGGDWIPYVRFKSYPQTVAVEPYDIRGGRWRAPQPIDSPSLRILIAWLQERSSDD